MEQLKQSWFGASNYCEKLGSLYRDNSMGKSIKLNNLAQINSKKLLLKYEKVNSSLSLHRDINSRVDLYSKKLNSYFASVSQLENEQLGMDLAATFIQKFIRGYLTRIKFSPLLIEVHKRLNIKKIRDLQSKSYFCMYRFGKNLKTATKIIQKAVRNFLFARKLKRFEIFYEQVLFQRDEIKMQKLMKLSFVLFSKFRLNHLRFLRNRERRLKKIKRKLAILTIKNVIAREKILIKTLKINIRKYKRRITLGLVANHKSDTEKTHEDETNSNHTEEEAKLKRMKMIIEMEEAKRKKIKLGKISYKVPKLKYFKVQSRLQKNESNLSASDSVEPIAKVEKHLPAFTPQPMIKAKFNRYSHLKSNYMGTTESFKAAVKGPLWMAEADQEQPKLPLGKLRSTIYRPTQFSEQKVKQKKVFNRNGKPGWCSNAMVRDQYIPSVFMENDSIGKNESWMSSERKPSGKRWRSEAGKQIRTVLEKTIVEEKSLTPVSCRFEEALPELSRFNKIYPRMKFWSFYKMSKEQKNQIE